MKAVRNLVVIGDTHFCSSTALFPPQFQIHDGQFIIASATQKVLWSYWESFWDWTNRLLHGEPYALIHNGDLVDNKHHDTLQLASGSEAIQLRVAEHCMKPRIAKAEVYYQIRGTPAHSGSLGDLEEMAAQRMGAKPDAEGNYSRYELAVQLGKDLIHFAHHIPTTTRAAYRSSPLMALIAESFTQAGEWGEKPPTILVRSHAHGYVEVKVANCRAVLVPSWQGKTEYVWKKSTIAQPVIGGIVIRQGEFGTHIRERIFKLPGAEVEKL